MGLRSLLTGGNKTATNTTGRTPRERARRERDIREADANTDKWLKAGGLAPKKRS
ncbi:hypothetical protein [Kitasatospora cathayae]|uniref:Integrase n=1 Tax=Kitasatospora cathayae TaxID=3004092 RepID=A0ABY7QBA3_9ACTN|nr:hypothetical protein [Kitasatospora sp. HUAS 3-15]WBP89514.1 hypothetical protein O1G21_29185 [Kitasatospora sp. HUAS 3-15]